jgi:hypothetical protein
MTEIMDKIFNKEIQYKDVYNFINENLCYSEEWNGKPYNYDEKDEFISTITISILACIKCFEEKDQKEYFIKMINEIKKLFLNYHYHSVDYNNKGFIEKLSLIFENRVDRKDKENEIRQLIKPISELIILKHDDYYNIQKNVYKLFNTHLSWHYEFPADYINYITFSLYAFIQTINENNLNLDYYLEKYLDNLLTIFINHN